MRAARSIFLVLAASLLAAGCTSQPAYAQMAPYGIDNMTYGTSRAAYGYAQPGYTQPAYPQQAYTQPAYAHPAYTQPTYTQPASPVYAQPASSTPQAASGYAYAQPASPNLYAYAGATSGYGYPGSATVAQPSYQLDSGDRLRIVVFGQDGLTNSYAVDASGHIAMPLIGSVSARGLTTDQLAHAVADKLRDGYIREPHVAVEVEAYRPFFILGEVTQPGQYPYVANMTAETAVAIAGGFGPRASRQSVVLIRSYNGQQVRMAVPMSYPLRPGDTINVQERWF
jgi:polysaccharide biosynthesis/export protein